MALPIWSSMTIYRYVVTQGYYCHYGESSISLFNSSFYLLQGTAAVVLAGLVASLKLLGGTLADHTFLFLGAGEVRLYSSLSFYCLYFNFLEHKLRKWIIATQ